MAHVVHWRWKNERAFRSIPVIDRGIYCAELEARITERQRLNQRGRKEGGESRVQLLRENGERIADTEFIARYTRVIAVRVPVAQAAAKLVASSAERHLPAVPPAQQQKAPPLMERRAPPPPVPRTHWLACPLCGETMVDAAYTSCCHTTFCTECIAQQLGEDRQCPVCACPVECPADWLMPNLSVRDAIARK